MPEEYKNRNYAKGYQAGRRYIDKEVLELRREVARLERVQHEKRQERIYFAALNSVLAHCRNWSMDDKPITTGEGYNKLAKIFAQHAISNIEEL
jgi:hypothetical protein